MDQFNTYGELHQLPEGAVIQDADGEVWCVTHPRHVSGETWLVPFSDEYACWVRPGGEAVPVGDRPTLPIQDTGLRSRSK